jgi:hypothetical protein
MSTPPKPQVLPTFPSASPFPRLDSLRLRLLARLRRITDRPPDEIIGSPAFLHRWDLARRNRWRSIYLHAIFGSDNQMVLHDHPWPSLSLILEGSYVEHTIRAGGIHERRLLEAGDIVFRLPGSPHRLEMPEGDNSPCWTLFLAGPRVREWGFHHPDRWIPWTELANQPDDAVEQSAEHNEVKHPSLPRKYSADAADAP